MSSEAVETMRSKEKEYVTDLKSQKKELTSAIKEA
jgi:muconolactone delta-isomerase